MLNRAPRRAGRRADMERPSPAWFVGRAANRHAADPNNLELALLKSANFIGLLKPLQDHIHIWSHQLVVAICLIPLAGRQDHFLDITQPVLAKKDLVADKERGRPEGTPRDRALGILKQPRLDIGVLDQLREAVCIEAG